MEENCGSMSPRPHALLLPYPSQGHLNPLMELGKRLAALGVRVTLATTDHLHAKIVRAQQALSHPLTSCHVDFTLLGVPDGLPPGFDRDQPSAESTIAIDENLEDRVVEVVHTLASQGRPITCIVGDFFLRWIPSLAHRTRLPEFIFWPQCASVFSILFHVDALVSAGYDPYSTEVRRQGAEAEAGPDATEVVTCIPGLPLQIRYADLPFGGAQWGAIMEWAGSVIRHRFRQLGEAQGVLVNSFQALEPEVYQALTDALLQQQPRDPGRSLLRLVGPISSLASESSGASLWEEEVQECLEWLDGQPPSSVVFVSFGSLAKMTNIEQVQELARGLVASGQHFLWVLRKDAISSMKEVDLEDALPHGFLEQTKHVGKVVRWAPQVKVLSHPSVGGFFSHCGWNSILESISNGVPILGWPMYVDQITNCRLMSHVWKMGQALELNAEGQATSDDIEKGVRQLMEGPHREAMRACAIQLQCLFQEVMHNSCELLSFVDDICIHASTKLQSQTISQSV